MEKVKFTCPLTGVPFEMMFQEKIKHLKNENFDFKLFPILSKPLCNHPIEHYPLDVYINERYELCISMIYFELVETVTPVEASEILETSRQRVTQILNDDIIPSHIVNGKPVFKLDDVLEYKSTRSVGRPKKED